MKTFLKTSGTLIEIVAGIDFAVFATRIGRNLMQKTFNEKIGPAMCDWMDKHDPEFEHHKRREEYFKDEKHEE